MATWTDGSPIPPTSPFRDATDAITYLIEQWFGFYQPDVSAETVYTSIPYWQNQIATNGVSGAFWLFLSNVAPMQAQRAAILAAAPKPPPPATP